ncbi:flagellar filament capping protein FliD [Chitinibacter sp. FCG-7]|uniref:Flagellar filament capping protein FliD n=1 Tax=Chitinibacter mangrovi TaxID=3153927 RepID=A0AAU7FCF9_9NEIS
MLNSISGRTDFYSRYGGADAIYGRGSITQSAGLSSQLLDRIYQLSAVDRLGASSLRLNNSDSFNRLSTDFQQKRADSTSVTLSTPARVQSAMSNLNAELKTLAAPAARNPLQASSSAPDILKAQAIGGGEPRALQNVRIEQLAQGQLSQSGNLANKDELVGQGRLTIQFGALGAGGTSQREESRITIDVAASDTLGDVARKISQAQPGLKASAIEDAAGARLQLESAALGAAQAFTITAQTNQGATATGNLATLAIDSNQAAAASRVAQDARVQIDGREIRSTSNRVRDSASNLQLDLLQTGEANVTLNRDAAQLGKNISQLIGRVNQAREQLNAVNAAENGAGASGLARREINRLEGVLNNLATGLGNERLSLNDLGITTAQDGKLVVNETRLSQQALARTDAVNQLFNDAVDQLGGSVSSSQQELAVLNSPLQILRSNTASQTATSLLGRAGFSLLQSGESGFSWRGMYGVSQYLQVAQFR